MPNYDYSKSKRVTGVCGVCAGMQSAALGFMLAQAHFADPLVAVPSAVSVVCMVRSWWLYPRSYG